jgi:glycosyltransferase involved in cell wall biosynthesis
MTTLLWFKPHLHPVVVTVHDIVPFLVRHDKRQTTFRHPLDLLFGRMAMSGLTRADALIADSHFTKATVLEALGYLPEKLFVVHLGVDHQVFRPLPVPPEFFSCYQLDRRHRYVLYVGSENPRKNLPRLIRAFARIREALPEARFIKIGSPEFLPQAEQLHGLIQEMGLADSVLFFEHIPDQDLALFYNLAEVFVFPSLYEGFGLPALEAMACGTPVVCSNAASLPEVVGDAAVMVDPYDVDALAEAMSRVLAHGDLRRELRQRGLERCRQFTWERTARETVAVYQEVCK